MIVINRYIATGIDPFGNKYSCNFVVAIDMKQKPTQAQMNEAVNIAMRQFREYHPTGQIVGQQNYSVQ